VSNGRECTTSILQIECEIFRERWHQPRVHRAGSCECIHGERICLVNPDESGMPEELCPWPSIGAPALDLERSQDVSNLISGYIEPVIFPPNERKITTYREGTFQEIIVMLAGDVSGQIVNEAFFSHSATLYQRRKSEVGREAGVQWCQTPSQDCDGAWHQFLARPRDPVLSLITLRRSRGNQIRREE
jgi:hypothetical protein